MGAGIWLAEHGLIPLPILRFGIRRLLQQRLEELEQNKSNEEFAEELRLAPIALETRAANEQHYEIPAKFFEYTLGPHLKYSGCFWPDGVQTLEEAERAALDLICDRARLHDGQDVLELGCGWGALSLYIAKKFPNSRVVAVSNSSTQRDFIEARSTPNLEIMTADMNVFDTKRRFDRVVSVEMFEHMRNYEELLRRIGRWLKPQGELFVHVFSHREYAYPFDTEGSSNWMGKYFFTGGLMPSHELFRCFDQDLTIDQAWQINGTHYARTARSWRLNLERKRSQIMPVLTATYGVDARIWYNRWRMFFLACEELFAFRNGHEWQVSHYRFLPSSSAVPA